MKKLVIENIYDYLFHANYVAKVLAVAPETTFHKDGKPLQLNGKTKTILDLWKWAYSNINNNTDRGVLAQYIVSWATGVDGKSYIPWIGRDVDLPNGKKVEVKATAKAQDWDHGKKLTKDGKIERPTRFTIKRSSDTDDDKRVKPEPKARHSDIYVLCYYKWEDEKTMDSTNLDHWDFGHSHVIGLKPSCMDAILLVLRNYMLSSVQ